MGRSGSSQNRKKAQLFASHSQSHTVNETRKPEILIVEDNPSDVFLIRRALKTANVDAILHFAEDGEKATDFFDQVDTDPAVPCLDLILLDINLPKKKGTEVIQHMRASKRCGNTLILIVTSSDSLSDRQEMDRLGANGYFKKASDFSEFMKLGNTVQSLLTSI